MPFLAPAVNDEKTALLAFLDQQRNGIRAAAVGLTDEQASAAPSASELSIAGLVKHMVRGEWKWMVEIVSGSGESPSWEGEDWADGYRLVEGETLAGVLADYDQVAARTAEIVAGIDDLGATFPAPEFPWFSTEGMFWSPRWVLLHLIEETARHAGHADIIRETIDGKTAFELIDALDESRSPSAPLPVRSGGGGLVA
jgi:hypothetical protein